MTITYTADVAKCGFRTSMKLLLKWRGSVFRLLWREFLVYLFTFASFSCIYRFTLNKSQKSLFEDVVRFCRQYIDLIPVAFILGFYVSFVVNRWWTQFNTLPFPSRMGVFLTSMLQGSDDKPRMIRRTVMRFFTLSFTICMVSISPGVKKRFPTLDHVRNAGFIEENEVIILENIKSNYNKFYIPLVWAASLLSKARKDGLIKDDISMKTLLDELNSFRTNLHTLLNYNWVNIPLVYTQVVILAVYLYFLISLIGRQNIDSRTQNPGLYFPLFTCFQFLFYIGWLKTAESILNPFGEDDDAISINQIIDKLLPLSYLIVDEMHAEIPELVKDTYWDQTHFDLPYTEGTKHLKSGPFIGSTLKIIIPDKLPDISEIEENVNEDKKNDDSHSLNNDNDSIKLKSNLHTSRSISLSKNQNIMGTVFLSSSAIPVLNLFRKPVVDFDESIKACKNMDENDDKSENSKICEEDAEKIFQFE